VSGCKVLPFRKPASRVTEQDRIDAFVAFIDRKPMTQAGHELWMFVKRELDGRRGLAPIDGGRDRP